MIAPALKHSAIPADSLGGVKTARNRPEDRDALPGGAGKGRAREKGLGIKKGGRNCRAFRSPSATGPPGSPPLSRARRGGAGRHDEARRETLNQPAEWEQNQLTLSGAFHRQFVSAAKLIRLNRAPPSSSRDDQTRAGRPASSASGWCPGRFV